MGTQDGFRTNGTIESKGQNLMYRLITFYYKVEIRNEDLVKVESTLDFLPSLLQNYWNNNWCGDNPPAEFNEFDEKEIKPNQHHLSVWENQIALVESFWVNDGFSITQNDNGELVSTPASDELVRTRINMILDYLEGQFGDGWGESWEQGKWSHTDGKYYYAKVGNLLGMTVQIGDYTKIKVKSVDEIKNLEWYSKCETKRSYDMEKRINASMKLLAERALKHKDKLAAEDIQSLENELKESFEKENMMNWVYANRNKFLHKWDG